MCFFDGGEEKLKYIGITNKERMKIKIIFNEAITPNSLNVSLSVKIKDAKPAAVV